MKKRASNEPATPVVADVNPVLELAKKQLEQMIDLNPDIIMLIDNSGRIMRVNKAFMIFAGSSDYKSVLGHNVTEIFNVRRKSALEKLISGESKAHSIECEANITGGATKNLLFIAVTGEKKSDLKVVLVKDITEEKATGRRLEKKLKMQAVEELTGALMHSINQPLTVITVEAQLMGMAIQRDKIIPEEFQRSLADIAEKSLEIAATLQKAQSPVDYQTQQYSETVNIVDLTRTYRSSSFFDIECPEAIDITYEALAMHDATALRHAQMCGKVSALIAEAMGIDGEKAATIKRCGTLHDIGKICIPDIILQKPAALSAEEKKTMMKHPDLGSRLLQKLTGFEIEAKVALSHHEFFNGQGYPHGLRGADIPIEARIVAVADVFDAMANSRHYHTATPQAEVIEYIIKNADTQFDPLVVKAFKSTLDDIKRLYTGLLS